MRHSLAIRSLCVPVLFLTVTVSARAIAAGDADPSVSTMRSVIDRYATDRNSLGRYYNLDLSPAYRERIGRFYEERLRELGAVDFEALDQAAKVDYLLLRNDVAYRPKQLRHGQKEVDQAAPLLPFAGAVIGLEDARRGVPDVDAPEYARALTEITGQVK